MTAGSTELITAADDGVGSSVGLLAAAGNEGLRVPSSSSKREASSRADGDTFASASLGDVGAGTPARLDFGDLVGLLLRVG